MTDATSPRDVVLAAALEALVLACELPGDHCEVAQALSSARSVLASSAEAFAGYVVVPMDLLTELADDVTAAVAQEFDRTEGYPSMQAKKAAAMEPVLRARALIADGYGK